MSRGRELLHILASNVPLHFALIRPSSRRLEGLEMFGNILQAALRFIVEGFTIAGLSLYGGASWSDWETDPLRRMALSTTEERAWIGARVKYMREHSIPLQEDNSWAADSDQRNAIL